MSEDRTRYETIDETFIRLKANMMGSERASIGKALENFKELFEREGWGEFSFWQGRFGLFIIASPDLKNLDERDLHHAKMLITSAFWDADFEKPEVEFDPSFEKWELESYKEESEEVPATD